MARDIDTSGEMSDAQRKRVERELVEQARMHEQEYAEVYEAGRKQGLTEEREMRAIAASLTGLVPDDSVTTTPYGSTLIRALESVWAEIQRKHPEVPDAIIVTGRGSDRKGIKLGHHAHGLWTDGEYGDQVTEIFLDGERMADGAQGVLSTLLHEAAHAINRHRGIKDVSGGRYHNKRFTITAQELGLKTVDEPHPSIGWSGTSCPDEVFASYETMPVLEEALILAIGAGTGAGSTAGVPVKAPAPTEPKPKTSGSLLKLVCGCDDPRIIRMSRKQAERGGIVCEECGEAFGEEDEA